MWERVLAVPSKQTGAAPTPTRCKRPFLMHSVEKHVITCQNRAWMDAAGMAMLCDVLIGPLYADVGGALIVWDNCGPHKVPAVKEVYDYWNIKTCELPSRCTSELQVLDLVVNGPLKAAIRRHRTCELFNYFQTWKYERVKAIAEGNELPSFAPPVPRLAEGLNALFVALRGRLASPEFISSLARVFVKV